MASPNHYSVASTAGGTTTTSRTIVMPTSPAPTAGMLLTAYISGESAVGSDTPTGGTGQTWSSAGTVANNGGGEYLQVWKAIALGGGNDALTVSGGSANRQAFCCATSMWDGTLANVAYIAATTVTLNPPNLNMTSSGDYLFYAFARNNNNDITGAPTTPGTYTLVATPILTSVVRLAVAYRAATVSAEDPGAFAGTASAAVAGVLGIRPGSSGPPPSAGNTAAFMAFF